MLRRNDKPRSVLLVGRIEDGGGADVLAPLSKAFATLADDVTVVAIAERSPQSVKGRPMHLADQPTGVDGVRRHVWSPRLRPATSPESAVAWLTSPIGELWASWPYPVLDEAAAHADVIVIQPDPAAALLRRLRRSAPKADIVCYAGAARDAAGLHPRLKTALRRDADVVDQIVVAARAMLPCFGSFGGRATYTPPGLEPADLKRSGRSPFVPGFDAVVIGPRPLDASVIQIAAATLAEARFHILGPSAGHRYPTNVIEHSALTEDDTQSFIAHADLGLVPFLDGPYADHAVDLCRELALFDHAGVPSVCPLPAALGKPLRCGYAPGRSESIRAALARTLFIPAGQTRGRAPAWLDVAAHIIGRDRSAGSTRSLVASVV